MTTSPKYRSSWEQARPHLPFPVLDGAVSSISLEILVDPDAWTIKDHDPKASDLWDMSQPRLCGFFLPPFQRPLVWDTQRMIAFVESPYLGIHLGTIVYNNALDMPMENGRFNHTDRWLIDGQQRCSALWNYVQNAFPVFAGTPHEHHWSELNPVEQRYFYGRQIGCTKLESGNEEQLRLVYDRLNFGGVPHTENQRALSPQSMK